MRIEQTVEVDAPIGRVWALVNDVPRVAPCMPGAALTTVVDERTYEGTVQVRLGPIRVGYKGTVVLEEVDEAAHSARMAAKGRDTKGAGTVNATVQTSLEPAGDGRTRLLVTADVQLTGKVAAFGRGMISDVAAKLFGQFAECLVESLRNEGEAAPAPAATETPATPASSEAPAAPAPPAAGAPAASAASEAPAAPAAPAPPAAGAPAASAASEAPAAPAPGRPPATVTEVAAPAPAPAGGGDGEPSPAPPPPSAPAAPAQEPREDSSISAAGLAGTVVVGRFKALMRRLRGRSGS
ncbi:MAG TPA: SRPBCC family protein [Actinomycetes bacterium]|nr:SRPBCC family protein [Actinomycetes bacterium]